MKSKLLFTSFNRFVYLFEKPFWHYNNVACLAYPLEGVDTIEANGKINKEASLPFIINGDTVEHLDMLNIDIIDQLLDAKWTKFAKKRFYTRLIITLFHLLFLSIAVYTRAGDSPNVAKYPTSDANTVV